MNISVLRNDHKSVIYAGGKIVKCADGSEGVNSLTTGDVFFMFP